MSQKSKQKLKRAKEKFAKITRGHTTFMLVVIGVAAVGTILTILSSADSPSLTSTNPNDVVVQYAMPHVSMATSTNSLATPMTPPFTLYGNGLLVCGHTTSMPFMSGMSMSGSGAASVPTSKTMTQDEVRTLISKIAATGYFGLKSEYYKVPVSSSQEIVRVNLASGEHFVMYYRDVAVPAAYKATVAILQSTCSTVTEPYLSSEVAVRAIANADPKGAAVSDVSKLPTAALPSVQSALSAASTSTVTANVVQDVTTGTRSLSASYAAPKPATTSSVATTIPNPVSQTVTGTTAQNLVKSLDGTQHTFVNQAGKTYEVAVDPKLPRANNPLQVNYDALRAQAANAKLGNRIKNMLNPRAYAAATTPVRVVILLPADGGNMNNQATAQALGQAVHDWYCRQLQGYCYDYQGVTVIRGSQTMAYYNACNNLVPGSDSQCKVDGIDSATMVSILGNIYVKDMGTIYRQDVDTLVVPGWTIPGATGTCGVAMAGTGLAVANYNLTSNTSYYCRVGSASAHELGHTFGLQHTDPSNGTLMDAAATNCDIGNVDPKINVCAIDAAQAQQLRNTPKYFQPSNLLPAAGSAPSTLTAGHALYKGQYLLSPGRQCMATVQADGNFVIYNTGLQNVFSMYTNGKPTSHLAMQLDGNFALYSTSGGVLWDGKSHNKGGTHLVMQDDCNFVLYTDANAVVWSSRYGAVGPQNLLPGKGAPSTLYASQSLYPGQYLLSPGLQCMASMQTDGNFVIYGAQLQVYFTTYTNGKPTNRATLEGGDGNFLLYANSGGVLWDSTSHNKGGVRLAMQDDCNFVLYNAGNNIVWSSKGGPVGPRNLLPNRGAPSTLTAGHALYPGQYLLSPGVQCMASMQTDGNFVVYGPQLQVYFQTNMYGKPTHHLAMQLDNNFAFYANSGGVLWDPHLVGRHGTYLSMQDDCNFVLYTANNTAVWSSKFGYNAPSTLEAGDALYMYQYLRSPNGQYRAILQDDGNFVVYNGLNQATFSARTQGHYDFISMQTDSNLVIYDISLRPLWYTNTVGFSNASRLVMQDDGNLVVYTPWNTPLWCSWFGRMY